MIKEAMEILAKGESLYILSPTHKSKSQLNKAINKAVETTGDNTYKELFSSLHVLGNNYVGEEHVLFDEISMLSLDNFYSILLKARHHAKKMLMFDDIGQLPPARGVGTLEYLLRSNSRLLNIDPHNFWKGISSLYKRSNNTGLNIPRQWRDEIYSINLNILQKNYRLNFESGLTHYDDNFYDYVFKSIIEKDDYTQELVNRLKESRLIIAPSHSLINSIDDLLQSHYGNNYNQVAPFVRIGPRNTGGRTYVNPEHPHYAQLLNRFYSIGAIPNNITENYTPTSAVTAHYIEGIENDGVTFYLGQREITSSNNNTHFLNNNMLYTAVSRAKSPNKVVLLGKRETFEKMRQTTPTEIDITANKIVNQNTRKNTMIKIENSSNILSVDSIYSLFLDEFEKEKARGKYDDLLDITPKKPGYIMNQFNPRWKKFEALPQGYEHHYEDWKKKQLNRGNSKGGKNKKGRGKVQQYVEDLFHNNLEEFNALKEEALSKVSPNDFQNHRGYNRYSVRDAITKIEAID
ncbi:AAA family ATPase [Pediococcus pentosaceus]|uniref:AAA family ATPase n=1 Tax=Pediococcus pentosaceus TaxID=1255 RepID=UPI001E5EE7EF|nr:AAA family ATPase [Pediococcus pentosaceus]